MITFQGSFTFCPPRASSKLQQQQQQATSAAAAAGGLGGAAELPAPPTAQLFGLQLPHGGEELLQASPRDSRLLNHLELKEGEMVFGFLVVKQSAE